MRFEVWGLRRFEVCGYRNEDSNQINQTLIILKLQFWQPFMLAFGAVANLDFLVLMQVENSNHRNCPQRPFDFLRMMMLIQLKVLDEHIL